MAVPTDVIIAGTKPFALALFAPVTERAGSRPRIAPEPAAALTLCAVSSDVLVVEYGPLWLPALTQLRQQHPGLRVVAALPHGQEGAALSLEPLSIDAVPWDGRAVSVLPAIERAIGRSKAAATTSPGLAVVPPPVPPRVARPPPLAPPAPEQAAPASPATPALDLFTDLGASAVTPLPASLAAEPGMTLSALPGRAAWPASGPGAAEAELLLRHAAAGTVDTSPLRPVIELTVEGLSPLEREVFTGGTVEVDAALIRHAAVLRFRVAAALATRPPPGAAVDGDAVAELLSEIDGVLDAVKGLLADAPPETRGSLEAIRNALVKEAVDFSEACHELGSGRAPPTLVLGRESGRITGSRLLSVHAGAEVEDRPETRRRRVVSLVLLAIALALGVAYHGWNYLNAPASLPPATYEGAPAGTMALQNGPQYFLVALPGENVNPAELERYRQHEAKRGNRVREIIPGTWIIEPDSAIGGEKP
jgi:hypothetical protein